MTVVLQTANAIGMCLCSIHDILFNTTISTLQCKEEGLGVYLGRNSLEASSILKFSSLVKISMQIITRWMNI